MKRARKVSNVYGEVHFKQKERLTIVFTGSTLPYRKQSVKAQSISLLIKLHAINMQLYQKWAPPRSLQETIINSLIKLIFTKLKYVWKHLSTETQSV